MNNLLIFGYGYSARAFSRLLDPENWRIVGTTRSEPDRATDVQWPGVDLTDEIALATHVLISIAPDTDGDVVLRRYSHAFRAAKHLKWVGYLSTTGVYGDRGGGWVDETSALEPATDRGRARVLAESQWQELAQTSNIPLSIFRLAGIYGPGRGPFSKVRAGTARQIIKPRQVFSRIHVDDIATILMAAVSMPRPGAIYNLCDDLAAPPQDVLCYAADLLEMPHPPIVDYETADLSQMARSFYAESKRVRNDRIKSDLAVKLQYPTFKIGLEALLRDEQGGS
jgi:nucleoside-diphosphate-sugar epimerase